MEYAADSFVLKAMEEYQLDVKPEARLRGVATSTILIGKKGRTPMTMALRTTGYITSMGSIFGAITQIADIGLAVWRSGRQRV